MSWGVVAGAAIGALGAGVAAKKQSKAAEKATAAQVQASDREIAFARESRDLARGDVEPYREAGYTALDALMSMTGLGAAATPERAWHNKYPETGVSTGGARDVYGIPEGVDPEAWLDERFRSGVAAGIFPAGTYSNPYRSNRKSPFAKAKSVVSAAKRPLREATGRLFQNRAHGGNLYNINELRPESVYENGSYTRSGSPKTVPPSNGYVAPNIQGRAYGGDLVGISDPNPDFLRDSKYGAQGDYINPNLANKTAVKFGGASTPVWRGNAAASGIPNRVQSLPAQETRSTPTPTLPPTTPNTYAGPRENPGGVEGGFNFMTDPGYAFRIGEGQRALERGAGARGGLLSGGFGRKLTRYAQDYASNEYTNVYNRIANIAGLGQVAGGQSGQAALYAGSQMGGAASNAGAARASGYVAQGNAWANAIDDVASLPWGDIFRRGGRGGGTPNPDDDWR
jgi:hypothetical protein